MKVKVNILTGPERHFWVYPYLHWGLTQWSHDSRLELYEEDSSGYGFHTSQEARNVICEKFMADERFGPTDCLMMIDNDTNPVNPKSGTMNNLMDLPLMGLPIVGCPVPVIHDKEWMLNGVYEQGDSWRPMSVEELSNPDKRNLVVTDGGPAVKVDAVGFGVVCIQKQVLEEMAMQGFFQVLDGKKNRAWSPPEPEIIPYVLRWRDDRGATVKGEDWLFCKRAKGLGIQTYIAPQHYCGHFHSYDYGRLPMLKYAVKRKPTQEDYHIIGPCPEITEWAIEPALADWIWRFLKTKPDINILELGSGVSTVLMDRHMGNGYLESLEHDHPTTTTAVRKCLKRKTSRVHYSPLVGGFYASYPMAIGYQLMLIDGPPVHLSPGGRAESARLFKFLSPHAVIILDDADREGEQRALQQWIGDGLVEFVERVGRAVILRKI